MLNGPRIPPLTVRRAAEPSRRSTAGKRKGSFIRTARVLKKKSGLQHAPAAGPLKSLEVDLQFKTEILRWFMSLSNVAQNDKKETRANASQRSGRPSSQRSGHPSLRGVAKALFYLSLVDFTDQISTPSRYLLIAPS